MPAFITLVYSYKVSAVAKTNIAVYYYLAPFFQPFAIVAQFFAECGTFLSKAVFIACYYIVIRTKCRYEVGIRLFKKLSGLFVHEGAMFHASYTVFYKFLHKHGGVNMSGTGTVQCIGGSDKGFYLIIFHLLILRPVIWRGKTA